MPIITFANPKGGSGKTTAALVAATVLAEKGASVTVIDAGVGGCISAWAQSSIISKNITVVRPLTEEVIINAIKEAARKTTFVIVDLGRVSCPTLTHVVTLSDFIICSAEGSMMDIKIGFKVLNFVADIAELSRREIPYAILLTRVGAAIKTRSISKINDKISTLKVPVFKSALVQRVAFREIFEFGCSVTTLDHKQSNGVDKAIVNAEEFVNELLAKLREQPSLRAQNWFPPPPNLTACKVTARQRKNAGRTAQLYVKIKPEVLKSLKDWAEQKDLSLTAAVERLIIEQCMT